MAGATQERPSATTYAATSPGTGAPQPQRPADGRTHLTSHTDPVLLVKANNKRSLAAMSGYVLPSLTGAAALAEERQHQQDLLSKGVSLNPAAKAVSALRGSFPQSMSRADEAPQSRFMGVITNGSITSEPMQIDHSPAAMPYPMSFEPQLSRPNQNKSQVESPTSTVATASPAAISRLTDRTEERSNKATSYPQPRVTDEEDADALRRMSLPSVNPSPSMSRSGTMKKHKCPYCDADFTRHHNLKSHLLTHSKEKPYSCSDCNLRFRRLHDLKRHSKLHTGEKSHMCPKCGRRFARGDALARHSKGPGGCAIRRGSAGGEDDVGDAGNEGDEGMEGVVYSRTDHESDRGLHGRLDEERAQFNHYRRRSEPHRGASDSQDNDHLSSSHRSNLHASTYPGSAAILGGSRGSYSVGGSSGTTVSREDTTMASPRTYRSQSNAQFVAAPLTYSQMVESPPPLSPQMRESSRMTLPAVGPGQSAAPVSQDRYTGRRDTAGGTSQTGGTPHHQTLPSLSSVTRHMGPVDSALLSPVTAAVGAQHTKSATPSPRTSTNYAKDGREGVVRDGSAAMAASASVESDNNMWEYIRNMKDQLARVTDELDRQKQQYEGRLSTLQDEIRLLRERAAADVTAPFSQIPASMSAAPATPTPAPMLPVGQATEPASSLGLATDTSVVLNEDAGPVTQAKE